jgi:hypothetical protein
VHVALLATETVHELPFSPPVYGVVAFGVLVGLLLVAFAFRNVGSRH